MENELNKRLHIAQKLRDARVRNGYSQEELASRSRLSLRTIQRVENGENEPRGRTLHLICSTLDLEVKDLIEEDNVPDEVVDISYRYLILLHFAAALGQLLGFANVVIPFIIWTLRKEDEEARKFEEESLDLINFQLLWSILMVILIIVVFLFKLAGSISPESVMPALSVSICSMMAINIIFSLIFAHLNNKGKRVTFPYMIRLLR